MKTPHAIFLITLTTAIAFLLGRWSPGKPVDRADGANIRFSSSRSGLTRSGGGEKRAVSSPRTTADRQRISAEKAKALTPQERVALLKSAAVLSDPKRQAEILCGLLSVMTKEELQEATRTLLEVQGRGNAWSQAVWNTLWTQWGRVDPMACLELSRTGAGLNTTEDNRCMMAGWMSIDPEAALAWARQGAHNNREASAAAFAIVSSAKGDLQKMQSAILSLSPDPTTTKACLHDYFDLAISTTPGADAGTIYESMDPVLQEAAWPVTMVRMGYTDPQAAAAWLEKNFEKKGRDYEATYRLVHTMVMKDPQESVEWVTQLPFSADTDCDKEKPHPAMAAIQLWMGIDTDAANAWLQKDAETGEWAKHFDKFRRSNP